MAFGPKNIVAQHIIAACETHGIDKVVVSPGSRNAPLIIGFKGSDSVKMYSVVDERCAAFFALGMALQLRKPVALLCTSGSALLNYYPAIAEAFYSNIPLIVLSTDRPEHLIDIGDGQTIRQPGVFDSHVLGSLNFTDIALNLNLHQLLNTAITERGPVHINIPFDEPLYEVTDQKLIIDQPKTPEKEKVKIQEDISSYADIWNCHNRKLVLVGAFYPEPSLQNWLDDLSRDPSVLILVENTANVSNDGYINSIDKLIFPFGEKELEEFRPDILLSIGGMIVSKKIKQHLRKYRPKHHWHVDDKRAFDTFHCLSRHFKYNINTFFPQFLPLVIPVNSKYQEFWMEKKAFRLDRHSRFLSDCPYSDLKVFEQVLTDLPKGSQLQLGNSSVIRYTQLFDIDPSISVFCNRGTSGIDGSGSTAVGAAHCAENQTIFISGDISFFYDSNALWNSYMPNNFRIIVINNGGGGIFRFIPGPSESSALDYFETPHELSAEHLCKMHKISYSKAQDGDMLKEALSTFFNHPVGPGLLEIFTPREKNDELLKAYFNYLKH